MEYPLASTAAIEISNKDNIKLSDFIINQDEIDDYYNSARSNDGDAEGDTGPEGGDDSA